MKYKHKTTGEEATLIKDSYNVSGEIIPKRFIENSCDWVKTEEKEYEILSVTYPSGMISTAPFLDVCNLIQQFDCKIHSVKRLSDGEIIAVGGTFNFCNIAKAPAKILEIQFEIAPADKGTGRLCFVSDNPMIGKWWKISELIKVKTPIFTTEDRVDLYGGESIYGVTDDFQLCYTSMATKENVQGARVFAKKENAEKFIQDNQKRFSLNSILKAIDEILPSKTVYDKEFADALVKLLKYNG